MATTTDPRTGLKNWSVGTDLWPGRAGWSAQQTLLAAEMVIVLPPGLLSARPVAAYGARLYFATDTARLYYDTGTQWVDLMLVGGHTPAGLTFGGAASEGASVNAARDDHTHGMPAHNAAAHSTIPISALAAATASVLMGGWRITGLADPAGAQDAVTQAYLAAQLTARLAATIGAVPVFGGAGSVGVSTSFARADRVTPLPALPVATPVLAGTMSAADKAKLDAAGTDPSVHSSLVMRDAAGAMSATRLFAGADAPTGHTGGVDEFGTWGIGARLGVSTANRATGTLTSAPVATTLPAAYPLGTSFATVANDASFPAPYGLLQTNRYASNRVTQVLTGLTGLAWSRAYDAPTGWSTWRAVGGVDWPANIREKANTQHINATTTGYVWETLAGLTSVYTSGPWDYASGVWTIPTTGLWRLSATVHHTPGTSGTVGVRFRQGWVIVVQDTRSNNGDAGAVNISGDTYATAGETITLDAWSTNPAGQDMGASASGSPARFSVSAVVPSH